MAKCGCKPDEVFGGYTPSPFSRTVCWDFTEPESVAAKPTTAAAFPAYIGVPGTVPSSLWLYNQAAGTSQPLPDETGFANLTATGTIYNGRSLVGLWGGSTYEDLIGGEYPDWLANYAAANTSIYDFDAATSFAFLTVFRFNWTAAVRGILGKIDTGVAQGYRLETATNGTISWSVVSSVGGTVARSIAGNHADGAWHYVIAGIDRTAQLINAFSDLNAGGTAGIGAIGTFTNAVAFRDGRARDNTFSMPGHRLFTAAFTGAAAEALLTAGKAAADAWWARMTTRSLPNIATYTRATPISTQVYFRSGAQLGERVATFAPNEVAYGWRLGYQHDTRIGLLGDPSVTNLLTNSDPSLTGWTNVNATSVTAFNTNPASVPAALDNPRGSRWGVEITRTAAGGNRYASVNLTNGTVYTFSVWLSNQNQTFIPRLRITDSTGAVVLATQICPVFPSTEWKRCSITATANATASFRFEIHPDDPANAGGVVYAMDAQVEVSNQGPTPLVPAFGVATAGSAITIDTPAVLDPEQGAFYADYVMDRVTGQILDSPPGGAAPNRRHLFTNSGALQSKVLNDNAGAAIAAPAQTLLTASPASHYEVALTWYARAAGVTAAIDYAGYVRATGSTAFVSGTTAQAVRILGAANSAGTVAKCCVYSRFLSSLTLAGRFGPQYPATQAAMLALTGLSFDSIWLCNEATGATTLADAIGGITLTRSSGTITQQGAVNNGGTAVDAPPSTNTSYAAAAAGTYDLGAADNLLLYMVAKTRNRTDTNANIAGKLLVGAPFTGYQAQINGSVQGNIRWSAIDDTGATVTATVSGYDFRDTIYHPFVFLIDRSTQEVVCASDLRNTGRASIAALGTLSNSNLFRLGSANGTSATVGVDIAYAAVATGAQLNGLDPKDFLRGLGWLVEGV